MYDVRRDTLDRSLSRRKTGHSLHQKNRNARSVSATICSRSEEVRERQTERESTALRSRRLPHVREARSDRSVESARLRGTSRYLARHFARGLPLRVSPRHPLSNLLPSHAAWNISEIFQKYIKKYFWNIDMPASRVFDIFLETFMFLQYF